MDSMKIGKSMRIFLLFVGAIIWIGIWHTGFKQASWLLYLPAVFFVFAAISGICPGMFFSKLMTGELKSQQDDS